MSNIHVEYTSGIFHKNMKNIYMHYGRVMRGVVNIVYFFPIRDFSRRLPHETSIGDFST